ncbi:tRNA 2-thiouridine(34) synthase MnmA [Buchnera aphidicola (Neophyllaphis podocarpi)]|uniref:tRNA 2-thiouridine(34) synthase MnmA n=1 Tax=Buchnera aphidicola TaxID=9 RepID=UPI0031B80DE4
MNKKYINKVIVGISGGVDSAVSAWLLKKQKYQVEGLFMKNWEEDDENKKCTSYQDLHDAKSICKSIGIKLHKINFSSEYWDYVFKNFIYEYKKGRTPNPDILCNKKIKFKFFLDFAIKELKADYIATGHYVIKKKINKETFLCKGFDYTKDQSYFLHCLNQNQLSKSLFPLGRFKKKYVREIAKNIGLSVANKKDSTGICFIGPKNINIFLKKYISSKSGKIVNINNKIIGKHSGLIHYTIGQRKGLKIGGIKNSLINKPWYVVKKDILKNILVVDQGNHNKNLMSIGLIANQLNWINKDILKFPMYCNAKTRYRQSDIFCKIHKISRSYIKVIFNKPVCAVTPGQYVVFYIKNVCLGGGVIDKNIPVIKDNTSNLI